MHTELADNDLLTLMLAETAGSVSLGYLAAIQLSGTII